MSPLFWGMPGWFFIHAVALGYPTNPTETDKQMYASFFQILATVLPCSICGKHFYENMTKNPIRLDNKMELFAWTVEMHNFVNESKGRRKLTTEEAYEEFKKNGEAFKNKSIFDNGITADSVAINDPQVKQIMADAISRGVNEHLKKKGGKPVNKNSDLYKIIIAGLIGYIVYLQFFKKKI